MSKGGGLVNEQGNRLNQAVAERASVETPFIPRLDVAILGCFRKLCILKRIL